MLTDLVQIRRLGEKERDENLRLRMHLKRRNFQERRLKRIAQEVEEQIDCTACANCCRVATVKLIDRDVERLARRLGVSPQKFLAEYTREDAEEGRVLIRNEGGCIFLEGNLCSVYEARPQNCANFPHLVRGTGSIVSRMWRLVERAEYCPIVYNWMEKVKEDIGF